MDRALTELAYGIIEKLRRQYWLAPTSPSRRIQDRLPWCVPLRLKVYDNPTDATAARELEVATHDLSAGGLSFVTRYYLHVGTRLEATFDSLHEKPTIVGMVRNCVHLGGILHRVGVQFTEVRKPATANDD